MSQHTVGPWTYRRIGPRRGPVRLTDKTFTVLPEGGPAFAYLPEGRDDIQEANARLIADAPALLVALKEIAKGQHHVYLSKGAAHAATCPPCIADEAIRHATGASAP